MKILNLDILMVIYYQLSMKPVAREKEEKPEKIRENLNVDIQEENKIYITPTEKKNETKQLKDM
jgi:hypothetical protein